MKMTPKKQPKKRGNARRPCRESLLRKIINNMSPEDKHPFDVIKENYEGDESRYLRDMRRYLK